MTKLERIARLQVLIWRAAQEASLPGYRGGHEARRARDNNVAAWQKELDKIDIRKKTEEEHHEG